jgi:hypothetical protein
LAEGLLGFGIILGVGLAVKLGGDEDFGLHLLASGMAQDRFGYLGT